MLRYRHMACLLVILFFYLPSTLYKNLPKFLGAFAKLQKGTTSFVASDRLSVPMKQLYSYWMDFDEIWYLDFFFLKVVEKIQISLKSDMHNGYFT